MEERVARPARGMKFDTAFMNFIQYEDKEQNISSVAPSGIFVSLLKFEARCVHQVFLGFKVSVFGFGLIKLFLENTKNSQYPSHSF